MDQGTPAFFDIGDTLASVTLSARTTGSTASRSTRTCRGVLAELRERGARLGIISDRGPIPAEEVNQALEAAGPPGRSSSPSW